MTIDERIEQYEADMQTYQAQIESINKQAQILNNRSQEIHAAILRCEGALMAARAIKGET